MAVSFPLCAETPRLRLSAPAVEDADDIRRAIAESFVELRAWLDWAREIPTLDAECAILRDRRRRHESGEELSWLMRRKSDGWLVGVGGVPRLCWERRSFEIGYWARTSAVGNGYVTECVVRLAQECFDRFDARRVEIRTSMRNGRSRRVAELAGFRCEAIVEGDGADPDGRVRDTAVYSVHNRDEVGR